MSQNPNEPISYLLGRVFKNAVESDFYSKDGLTWDETADGIEYLERGQEFGRSLIKSAQKVDTGSTADMSRASEELLKLIERVEARNGEESED